MQNKKKLYGYTAIIVAVILWGMSFVWTKELLYKGFPVFTIVLSRLIVASSILLLLFKPKGQIERIKKDDISLFFLLALFEPFLYFIGENFGLLFVSPSVTSAIIALIPIVTALSLYMFYKEHIHKKLFVGAAISVIGIVIMSFGGQGKDISIGGLLLLLLAVLSATMYGTVLQKILRKGYGPITITTFQNIIAIIYYLPCFLIFDINKVQSLDWSFAAITDIIVLGVLCSAVAFALYSVAAKLISVAGVVVFTNIIPIVTLIMSVTMGIEKINIQKIVGILVVIGGVLLSQWGSLKKD
ncbi:MAG: DMT family transporter [Bacteroidales bacterium]